MNRSFVAIGLISLALPTLAIAQSDFERGYNAGVAVCTSTKAMTTEVYCTCDEAPPLPNERNYVSLTRHSEKETVALVKFDKNEISDAEGLCAKALIHNPNCHM